MNMHGSNHVHHGIVLKNNSFNPSLVTLFTSEFGKIDACLVPYRNNTRMCAGMLIVCTMRNTHARTFHMTNYELLLTPDPEWVHFYWVCRLLELLDFSLPYHAVQELCFEIAQNILIIFTTHKILPTKMRLLCILLLLKHLALNEDDRVNVIDFAWLELIVTTLVTYQRGLSVQIMRHIENRLETIDEKMCCDLIERYLRNHPRFLHFKTFDALYSQRINQ